MADNVTSPRKLVDELIFVSELIGTHQEALLRCDPDDTKAQNKEIRSIENLRKRSYMLRAMIIKRMKGKM